MVLPGRATQRLMTVEMLADSGTGTHPSKPRVAGSSPAGRANFSSANPRDSIDHGACPAVGTGHALLATPSIKANAANNTANARDYLLPPQVLVLGCRDWWTLLCEDFTNPVNQQRDIGIPMAGR